MINGMNIFDHFISYISNEKGQTNTTTQNTPTPTSTESNLMSNELSLSNAALPGQIQNQGYAQNLQGLLMTGQALPGYLSSLPGGVSQGQSMNEAALGNQSIATQYQAMGGLDSGSAVQSMAGNTANTLNQNAQFNTENLANLLNLASGQAYQNAGLSSSNNSMLGSQSGALASTNQTMTQNPFLNSLYSSIGTQLGQGTGDAASTFLFG